MPANKNALIRYYFIDEMLKSKVQHYTTQEICDRCNLRLENSDLEPASKRTYQTDLLDISMPPFCAEVEHEYEGRRFIHYYKDPTFSIFKPRLSDNEKNLLAELLGIFGKFDIEGFEWLDDLKKSLNIEDKEKIILFDSNPDLKNSNLLPKLFSVISAKTAINLEYQSFDLATSKTYSISPYMLKQYNNRWFLIAASNDDGFICTFALDRINGFIIDEKTHYHVCTENLYDRYDEIVGVTFLKDAEPQDIVIWADDKTYKYIETKPIHNSQKTIKGEKEHDLREKYPSLKNGKFFSYNLIVNVEFKNILMSYSDVVVLKPTNLQEDIRDRIDKLQHRYRSLYDDSDNFQVRSLASC